MTDEQCYEILKLNFGATEEEIKKQHKILSRVWHPDKYAGDPPAQRIAEDELKKLNNAREQLLKSVSNSSYNQQNNSQTPKVHYPTPDNTPNKRKSSRLGVVALGILVVFVTVCGTSIYIGTRLFGSSNEDSKNTSTSSPNPFSQTNSGNPKISFKPEVNIQIQTSSTNFRIQPISMYPDKYENVSCELSICNTGNQSGSLSDFKLWYTPSNGGQTINWEASVSLKPSECDVLYLDSRGSNMPSRPFGKLNYTMGTTDILGSIDLSKSDSQGLIQIDESTKDKF